MFKSRILAVTALLFLYCAPSFSTAWEYDGLKGKKIYDQTCFTCHASGVADAPIAHDIKTWEKHFEAAALATQSTPESKTTMTYLINQVIKGKKAMPPKGLCDSCSEKDMADAIHYMATSSEKP